MFSMKNAWVENESKRRNRYPILAFIGFSTIVVGITEFILPYFLNRNYLFIYGKGVAYAQANQGK